MSIVNVHKWLSSGQDYDTGVLLAKDFLQDNHALMALLKHRSSLSEQKLHKALSDFAERNPLQEAPAPAPTPSPAKSRKKHVIGQTDNYPEHLVELDKQTLRKIKERDQLRPLLFVLPEGDELKKVAMEVVKLDQWVTSNIDNELGYFAQHGKVMPGTEPVDGMRKIAQLMLALKNHPSYISKHQKSKNEIVQLEIARRKAELDEANNFIKQHT